MTGPDFIDLVLTPIGAGIGSAIGMRIAIRRGAMTVARPGFVMVTVGIGTAVLLAGFKWLTRG
jgi:hypothetical protein